MRIMLDARNLLVGITTCVIIGWWLLSVPLTQPDTLRVPSVESTVGRNPRGSDIESLVGRGSEAPKAQRNPTHENSQRGQTWASAAHDMGVSTLGSKMSKP